MCFKIKRETLNRACVGFSVHLRKAEKQVCRRQIGSEEGEGDSLSTTYHFVLSDIFTMYIYVSPIKLIILFKLTRETR